MRVYEIIQEGEVIRFPNRSATTQPAAAVSAADGALPDAPVQSPNPPEKRYGDPSNRLVFTRISSPKASPGQHALDLVWNATLVQLPPLVVRAILNLQPDTPTRFRNTLGGNDFVVRRDGNALHFAFSIQRGGVQRWSNHKSSIPVDLFAAKAEKLLQRPRATR